MDPSQSGMSRFDLHGEQVMQRRTIAETRAVTWDDDSDAWSGAEMTGELSASTRRYSWLTRQFVAGLWIIIAWVVGTVVFELGAIS